MARPKPEKKPEPKAAEIRVLPMQLQIGDRLADEAGVWEVIGRPYTSANGKTVHARVQRVAQLAGAVSSVWGAHERVAVKRTGGA